MCECGGALLAGGAVGGVLVGGAEVVWRWWCAVVGGVAVRLNLVYVGFCET